MRVRYDPEADVLLLIFRNDPPVDAIEEHRGGIMSYGEDGEPVSAKFLRASARRLMKHGEMSVTLQTESIRG